MTIIIDRFEEDYAVLELQNPSGEVMYKNIPLLWLPEDAVEGDVLIKADGKYNIDTKATEKRRSAAAERLRAAQDLQES